MSLPSQPETGQRVGRYELRRELGRGTMGLVYEAFDPQLGRRIALKTLHLAFVPSHESRDDFEQRFLIEAQAAARLQHPGIVVVHDVGRDPGSGTPFMALEYLEGQTLSELLRERGAFPWREAVALCRRVAVALGHAHANGVVHRDIKPANIMVLPGGEPKIMDFGIAKLETAQQQLTVAGQSVGTPLYMSPEQALGQPTDARSDLFSLGAILYALVTGRLAFAADNVPRIVTRVVQEDPEPATQIVPGLPEGLDLVLRHALAKAPAARYPSAEALAADLQDLEAGAPPRQACGALATDAAVEHTRVSAATANPLEQLLEPSPAAAPPRRAAPLGQAPLAPPLEPPAARPARRGFKLPALAAAALAIVGLGLWLRPRPEQPPGREASTREPAAPAVAAPTPTPADENGTSQLVIDFEHGLRAGLIKVWVDDRLVLEQPLEGHVTRKIAGLRLRKGGLEETLELGSGRRTIDVQVSWDDNVKRERISGTFKDGKPRRLAVRLGRLLKNLSLEWS